AQLAPGVDDVQGRQPEHADLDRRTQVVDAQGDDQEAERQQGQAERLLDDRGRLQVAATQARPQAGEERGENDNGDGVDRLEVAGGDVLDVQPALALLDPDGVLVDDVAAGGDE